MEFSRQVHHIPNEFIRDSGLWLLRVGQSIAKPNFQRKTNIVDFYNIHFILDGRITLTFDEQSIVLDKGDAFYLYPGISLQYTYCLSDAPLRMLWISFDGAQAPALLAKAGFCESAPFVRHVLTKELYHAIHQLFVPPFVGFKRQVEFHALLYQIFGCLIPPDDQPHLANVAHWIAVSLEYMQTHFMECSVQDVSDYVNIHRSHFSKMFTRQVGTTPIKYLERLKMERAKQLLQRTTHSIYDISQTLGYQDQYTFTRAFARYFGLPPGQWRRIGP
jgi:AraC-like DNA-binding protein